MMKLGRPAITSKTTIIESRHCDSNVFLIRLDVLCNQVAGAKYGAASY
jgi:hypothetical protein